MAESTTVSLPHIESFKRNALHWANHFRVVCLLDSNDYPQRNYRTKSWILAVEVIDEIACGDNAFEELKKFQTKTNVDIFGFFCYDLKNEIEKLSSNNLDGIKFPDMYFFKPRYLIEIIGNQITVNRNYPETFHLIDLIQNSKPYCKLHYPTYNLQLRSHISKEKYLRNIELIQEQIREGDFYELNYCNDFYSKNTAINPVEIFLKLNMKAKAPFSCFFKLDDKFLLCSSPERFLKKEGNKIIAQPIKGTVRKGNTIEENELLKSQLQNDKKEQAENVMIVDLVRNDLAKSSNPGSVKVEELLKIYDFNIVNQMVSTVSSETKNEMHFVDIIKNAFPMGSMTGTPKVTVMEYIEKYENIKRGLFSGSVGYITPDEDFDFNVVIRSVLYNSTLKYISLQVGGAITYDSVPEKEYNEILLKAKGMMEILNAKMTD